MNLSRLVAPAFVGALLWTGAFARSATADEAATAIAAPAVRAAERDACRIVAPRFEPAPHAKPPAEEARFVGGAKLRFLVAAPCRREPKFFDA